MSPQSIFQLLPPHVVECIVRYVINNFPLHDQSCIPVTERLKAWLKPLLWVCSIFRYVSLPYFCYHFSLDFASSLPRGYNGIRSFANSTGVNFATHCRLAKCLTITVNEHGVYSGETSKKLSLAPYNSCSLSKARTLWLLIASNHRDEGNRLSSFVIEANIAAFVRQVQQIAPEARKIQVQYYPLDSTSRPTLFFGGFASQIFQLANHIEYVHWFETKVPVRLELDITSSLTFLHLRIDGYDCPLIRLVQRNAPTLQLVRLSSNYIIDLAGLILSPDSSYVVYPHLHTLSLRDERDDYVPERVAFKGVVPFPNLRRIFMGGHYPFGDDVLFRGNSATLESITLLVSDLLVSIVTDYNIFTPTSHPRLRYVSTRYPIDEIPSQFDTPAEALQFMLSIGSIASVRNILGDHSSSDLVPALISSSSFTSIKTLVLRSLCPELLDLIAIVGALPALLVLETLPPILGSITRYTDMDELPSYVLSTYAPVDRRFRYQQHELFPFVYHVENVKCVLLLALVYPNVIYSDTEGCVIKDFVDEVDAVLASDMFKPHVPRLQRFLSKCLKAWSS